MQYHLILTEICNAQCKYCYEKSMKEFNNNLDKKFHFDFSAPTNSEIDLKKLEEFLSKDKNPTIIFYGGEPLLQIEKIKQIIDKINVPFRMQTNALLLDKLPIEYLNKIQKILISIDGDEKITDFNRGKGTYEKIISNITKIRKEGYQGEIIARMTISQKHPEIFEQIKHLIETKKFDSVHWQIDAGFYKFDFDKKTFQEFVKKYNEQISKLIEYWIKEIQKGKVLRFYPFIDIIEDLLHNRKTKLRCGAGHSGYTITTNGKIVACPIMNNIKEFEAGDLNSNPEELKKFEIENPCKSCAYLNLCGGRCLYWNKAKLWPAEGDKLICDTIKYLIDELKKQTPIIKELISQNKISLKDFEHEKYFGPEIIP
ncbi:TIGR04084 family radical SAM/SPASM domain-containing protein [Candidatus Pacearchaeota archaeon]|nr:TIGR04084 family radical SAM/SPASM domain-containing protein [Candidatus Pacearchaeota archaeon]